MHINQYKVRTGEGDYNLSRQVITCHVETARRFVLLRNVLRLKATILSGHLSHCLYYTFNSIKLFLLFSISRFLFTCKHGGECQVGLDPLLVAIVNYFPSVQTTLMLLVGSFDL